MVRILPDDKENNKETEHSKEVKDKRWQVEQDKRMIMKSNMAMDETVRIEALQSIYRIHKYVIARITIAQPPCR